MWWPQRFRAPKLQGKSGRPALGLSTCRLRTPARRVIPRDLQLDETVSRRCRYVFGNRENFVSAGLGETESWATEPRPRRRDWPVVLGAPVASAGKRDGGQVVVAGDSRAVGAVTAVVKAVILRDDVCSVGRHRPTPIVPAGQLRRAAAATSSDVIKRVPSGPAVGRTFQKTAVVEVRRSASITMWCYSFRRPPARR